MIKKNEIIEVLHDVKQEVQRKYKVNALWAFGSFMRGEQKKGSDIDILVDFDNEATLFDWAGLGLYLEEKLGRKVDIITKKSVRREWKNAIFKEMVKA